MTSEAKTVDCLRQLYWGLYIGNVSVDVTSDHPLLTGGDNVEGAGLLLLTQVIGCPAEDSAVVKLMEGRVNQLRQGPILTEASVLKTRLIISICTSITIITWILASSEVLLNVHRKWRLLPERTAQSLNWFGVKLAEDEPRRQCLKIK